MEADSSRNFVKAPLIKAEVLLAVEQLQSRVRSELHALEEDEARTLVAFEPMEPEQRYLACVNSSYSVSVAFSYCVLQRAMMLLCGDMCIRVFYCGVRCAIVCFNIHIICVCNVCVYDVCVQA